LRRHAARRTAAADRMGGDPQAGLGDRGGRGGETVLFECCPRYRAVPRAHPGMSQGLNPPSLAEAINAKGFSGAAGFRVAALEPGYAELALSRRDDLLQFFGHFHGGVITALADQAAGMAVTSSLPKGRIGVTVELKINFLEPAS